MRIPQATSRYLITSYKNTWDNCDNFTRASDIKLAKCNKLGNILPPKPLLGSDGSLATTDGEDDTKTYR